MACQCPASIYFQRDQGLASLSPYVYIPLAGARHIRLFTLRSGTNNAPIQGTLSIANIDDDSLKYVALSYAWGTSKPSHLIECDGQQLLVPCNLFSALNRLRHEIEDVTWFMDFVCINQSLEESWLIERAAQVRLMRDIFSQASLVFIDLGQESEHMDEVVMLMDKLASIPAYDLLNRTDVLDEVQKPPFTLEVWDSLVRLFQSPWFGRIWTVQEYALANTPVIVVGENKYSHTLVLMSIATGFAAAAGTHRNQGAMMAIRARLRSAHEWVLATIIGRNRTTDWALTETEQPLTLAHALKLTIPFEATDWRDRVYGILGLVRDIDMSNFRIDYKESAHELSRRISLLLLRNGEANSLLYYLASIHSDDLPSWMMDLEKSRRPTGIDRRFLKNESCYHAGGSIPNNIQISDDEKCLSLMGLVAGKIVRVLSLYLPTPSYDHDHLLAENSRLVIAWDIATQQWLSGALEAAGTDRQYMRRDYRLATSGGGRGTGQYRCLIAEDLENDIHDRLRQATTPEEWDRASASFHRVLSLMSLFCDEKRLAITEYGRVCLVPQSGQQGDAVVIFASFPVPFLVRPIGDLGYRVLGGTYICGCMNGERVSELARHGKKIILR